MNIEKGVPMPTNRVKYKYPFVSMEVGDSFVFTGIRQRLASAANVYQRQHGTKYSIHKLSDTEFRCWRIS